MTPNPRPRIALLIDADNAQASKIDLILNELSVHGETSIRRAYGNWTKPNLNPWVAILHTQAISPVQQFDLSRGKNASDMAMVVDAMSLLYNDRPDAFGIVSSDADFTPLVTHLRGKGAAVYGFGDAKTPEAFQKACTRFLLLDQLAGPDDRADAPPAAKATARKVAKAVAKKSAPAPVRKTTAELRQDAGLVRLLRGAVQSAADDDGWAKVGRLGQQISNQSSFDSRNYGYATLTKLLAASELFDFRDEGTSALAVRDKRLAGNGT
ncbi:MAG TPA: NYN domain-containing protein [Aeromicrobium sp.]|nr:NYN domain-containing protein [Aeromicrobium sp.]HKY57091.1 NYN domain-containing protein [Aeromicrobium sp.]